MSLLHGAGLGKVRAAGPASERRPGWEEPQAVPSQGQGRSASPLSHTSPLPGCKGEAPNESHSSGLPHSILPTAPMSHPKSKPMSCLNASHATHVGRSRTERRKPSPPRLGRGSVHPVMRAPSPGPALVLVTPPANPEGPTDLQAGCEHSKGGPAPLSPEPLPGRERSHRTHRPPAAAPHRSH